MTSDGWIRWYYQTRDSFGAPALDFVDSTGRMFVKKCEHTLEGRSGEVCGSKVRNMKPDGNWICGNFKCAKPWAYEDVYIFKGEVQKSVRVHTFDTTNARYFDVAHQLYGFMTDDQWRWGAKLYVAHALGWSERRLAVEFPLAFPDAPVIRKSQVHNRIVQARLEWEIRLHAAHIPVHPY